MRQSLALRTLAGAVLVLLIAVGLFAAYALQQARAFSQAEAVAGLEGVATTARAVLAPLIEAGDRASLQATAGTLDAETGVRITVVAADGIVLADSRMDPAAMENHGQRPEVAAALAGRVGVASRLSTTTGGELLYVAVPVAESGSVVAVVRASSGQAGLALLIARARQEAAIFAGIVLAVGLVAAYVFTRRLTAPIRLLTGVVRRVAQGDFAARLHLRRTDEVRELADSVNAMAGRLAELFASLDRSHREFDGLLTSVAEGIALVGDDGRILRSNAGFERLVGASATAGRLLWEIVREPALMDAVRGAREGRSATVDVMLAGRLLRASVISMGPGVEQVLVLQDVTEARNLEAAKRELVANASHELRTPLASAQGYLELLAAQLEGEPARMLAIVRRNADRMAAIVADLLTLSKLEASGAPARQERVDLAAIASDVLKLFEPRAKARGLAIDAAMPADLPPVAGDPGLVEQLLTNLVDNAVRYTERGFVRIKAQAEGAMVRLEVEDSGIGIPPEHQDRIFERFYVVDKARSRETGGTGLGLSIVKHIAQRHGGTVAVESAVGRGSRFIVRLPAMLTGN